MLIMIKNATNASREIVVVPYSKMKNAIATCLLNEGYLAGIAKKTKKGFPVLELSIVPTPKDGTPKVSEVKRISKPSRRVYVGVRDMKPVKNGRGILVISTPKGILTDKQAKKEMVGGEALFTIA